MKRQALAVFAAFTLFAVAHPPQAHAACLTGCALENYAQNFFANYMTSQGYTPFNCSGVYSGTVRWECALGFNPIYWRAYEYNRASGCPSASTTARTYEIWIHPTSWQWNYHYVQCSCSGGNTSCTYP